MKKNLFCLLVGFGFFCHPLGASSITEGSNYQTLCLNAANDDVIFSNFKRAEVFRGVLEHVSGEQGREYIKIIKAKYPKILKEIDECRKNDAIGSPLKVDFGADIGEFSPTTIRYMKVAGDILDLFGNLKNKKIIEIGGGYGGQCKILSLFAKFGHYTIVDLPEVSILVKKYLSKQGVSNFTTKSKDDFQGEASYDLVISNYAFSEISKDAQQVYIDQVLNRSSCGYITCNFISKSFGLESYTLNELLDRLAMPGRSLKIYPEEPITASGNLILAWRPEK